MKRAATILLLLSVISIALFGLTTLHSSAHDSHAARCLASAFSTTEPPCPETDIVGFISFHVKIFSAFSLATLIAVISFIFISQFAVRLAPDLAFAPIRAFSYQTASVIPQFRTASELRWHSLHENSPAVR